MAEMSVPPERLTENSRNASCGLHPGRNGKLNQVQTGPIFSVSGAGSAKETPRKQPVAAFSVRLLENRVQKRLRPCAPNDAARSDGASCAKVAPVLRPRR